MARLLTYLLVSVFVSPLLAQTKVQRPFMFSGKTMGTSYHIKFFGLPAPHLQASIDSLLEEINRQMSTYRRDSEIAIFNQMQAHTPFRVSDDFFSVALIARNVYAKTGGAFDPTLGLVVNLWGFGPEGRQEKVPSSSALKSALDKIGYDKFKLNTKDFTLTKPYGEVKLDFSAVAKGFGVDKVAEYLDANGILNYMVEIGGEVRTRGQKNGGQPWIIGIEMPIDKGVPAGLIPVTPGDQAMATSGDYRNYFEINGKRMSHIIDPRSGYPISHNLASVSALAPSCAEADAMATAMMVLGAEEGMKLALKENIPAYFIVRSQNSYIKQPSPAMLPFLRKEEL